MLRNYFLIAWRNIIKNRFYSVVNIVGLASGIAFTLVVAAYIWGELQINTGLKNGDNQYIIQSKWKDPNMGLELTTIGNLAKALKEQYPNLIADYYRWDGITTNVSTGDKIFREGLQICDSTLLQMYGFKLLYGNAATALNNPTSVVISENMAIKYFGKKDVIGQTLTIDNFSGEKKGFMISGVLDKQVQNSVTSVNDDNFNQIFIPSSAIEYFGRSMDNWITPFMVGYVQLQPGIKTDAVMLAMKTLLKANASEQVSANLEPFIVPLNEYYLRSNNGLVKKTLYVLSSIALFILAMAIINFINMCISRSGARMKEIGIRKVMGGVRNQLVVQFLAESVLLVVLSTFLALAIYQMVLPFFSHMLQRPIVGLFKMPGYFWAFPFLLALLIGLLAGIYPAFILSSIQPSEAVKGKLTQIKENVWLRKTLVGFQFGTAMVVFIGALVVSQQVNLFFSKDLGYNKDYILYTQLPREWSAQGVQKMETIKQQFAQMPEVSSVSLSFEIPNGKYGNNVQLFKLGSDSAHAIPAQLMVADNDYASTYGIPLQAGSFFTSSYTPSDSAKIVINETNCKALGYAVPADAIGQLVKMPGSTINWTICGVTKDFHMASMQGNIQPIVFMNVNFNTIYRVFSFKLKPGDMEATLAALQKKWVTLLPAAPFDYGFMDDALKKMYQTEIQLKKASYTATILAIIIVLLGVIGLISLSIQKRTKEIGIRKVLGSSVVGIISLFIKDFLSIIVVASLFACPLAWYIMHNWLNTYAHRINISSFPFVVSITMLIVVTAILIIIQTIKTALANPVKSLRSE